MGRDYTLDYKFIPHWKSDFAKRPVIEFFLKFGTSFLIAFIFTYFLYVTSEEVTLGVWIAIFCLFLVAVMFGLMIFGEPLHELGRRNVVLRRIGALNSKQARGVITKDALKTVEIEYDSMVAEALDELSQLLAANPSEEKIRAKLTRLNKFMSVNPILELRLRAFEDELERELGQQEASKFAEAERKKQSLLYEDKIRSADAARAKQELIKQENRRAFLLNFYVAKIDQEFSKVGNIVVREFEKRTKRSPYGQILEANTEPASLEFLKTINLDHSDSFDPPHGFENPHSFGSPKFYDSDFEAIFSQLHKHIAHKVASFSQKTDLNFDDMTPIEFEHHVANELRKNGWEAEVTKASGDQGIDVIAKRDQFQVGIQCKYYKGSVPNKAIQEAFAGKSHYQLNGAAVVTTGNFTKSALEIANSTGVVALSYHFLGELHERFGLK